VTIQRFSAEGVVRARLENQAGGFGRLGLPRNDKKVWGIKKN